MAWTAADEARFQELESRYGQSAAPVASNPPPDGFFPRFGKGLANAPSNIAEGLINAGVGAVNFAFPHTEDINPVNVPKPYDLQAPQTQAEQYADIGSGIVTTVGELLIPGGALTKGARLAGAGRYAPIIGDLAAGAYLGAKESPTEAAGTATEFGLAGAANTFLPSRLMKVVANAAIPITGQLMRGKDPTSAESLIQTGANVAVPLILGGRRPKPAQTQAVVPDEVIPPGVPLALPGPTVAPSGQHWRQLPWRHGEARTYAPSGEPIATHPATIPRETLALPGPTAAPSAQPWRMLEWPHGEARSFSPSGEVIPMPNSVPSVEVIPPTPLLKRAVLPPNPANRTIEEAINAKDIVRYAGKKGHLTRGEDGIYFRPLNKGPEARVYGDIPSDPLGAIEGVDLKWAGKSGMKSLMRKESEGGFTNLNNPALQYTVGAGAGAIAGPVVFQDEDMSLGEKMLRGAGTGAAMVGLGRGLMRARANAQDAQKMGVLPEPLRKMMPKTAAKLDSAATDQTRGIHTPLGAIVRFAEQNLDAGRLPEVFRALERGKGQRQLLTENVMTAYKRAEPTLADISPAERAIAKAFVDSDGGTAAITALDRSNIRPELRDLLKTMKQTQIEAQDTLALAESDPRKKALLRDTRGSYSTRAYLMFTDPKRWLREFQEGKRDVAFQKTVDQFMLSPEFKGADRQTVADVLGEYLNEAATQKGRSLGSGSTRIDRALYISRKDLNPQQWKHLEALQADARLHANERMALQDIVREQNITPTDRSFLRTLAKNQKLSDAERATLGKIAEQETISPALRELLGEHTDPFERQIFTVNKLLGSVHQARTISELEKVNLPDGRRLAYTTEERMKAAAAAKAAGDTALEAKLRSYSQLPKSPGFGSLSGKWVDRQVEDALNAFNDGMKSGWGRWYAKFNSFLKENMTVMNPGTHGRQWAQVPLMGAMARVYNPARYAEALKIIRDKQSSLREEMVRNNVFGADFASHDLVQGARELPLKAKPRTMFGKAGSRLSGARQFIRDVYGMPDDIVRAATYLEHKPRFLREGQAAGLSGDALERFAQDKTIDFVQRYTMNYGAQNRVVNAAKNIPGINPFISYTAEMARLTKNLLEDVAIGSPADRTHAALNLALLYAAPAGLMMAAKHAFLDDKDREVWDKIEQLQPTYMRHQLKVPLARLKDGSFRYFNLTPSVPAGDFAALIRDAINGDLEAIGAEQPVFGWFKSPVAALVTDLATGEHHVTGQKIETTSDKLARTYQAIVPPVLGMEGRRIFRSFTPNDEGTLGIENARTGRRDTPVDAGLGIIGMRTSAILPKRLLQRAVAERNEQISIARRELGQVLQTNATPAAKEKARKLFRERVKEVNAEYRKLMQRAK